MTKVLIVDDIPDNVKLLAYDLDEAGFEVLTASNGREALRQIHKHGPELVLTDCMMPDMDGLELCRAIRSGEGIGFTYIIMLTAYAETEKLLEAFEAGTDDFLAKPFNPPELHARLKAGVRIIQLEADLAKERLAIHKTNAELNVLNDTLNRLATTDELTALANRREAMRQLDDAWAMRDRHKQPLSCLMFDIDHFKQCNDKYGHDVGDAVLKHTARVMTKALRKGERLFRFGGEEFLVLCPVTNGEQATLAAERLRAIVENNTMRLSDVSLQVTVSVGVAAWHPNMRNTDELLKAADRALYRAKHQGRNCVCTELVTTTKNPQTRTTPNTIADSPAQTDTPPSRNRSTKTENAQGYSSPTTGVATDGQSIDR